MSLRICVLDRHSAGETLPDRKSPACWSVSGCPVLPHATSPIFPAASSSEYRWRALANRPEILLLDEPTSALDEQAKVGIEELIRKFSAKIALRL